MAHSKRWQIVVLLALVLSASARAGEQHRHRQPKVQIAILLDNSGSMGGLINQARTQLWQIVTQLANARRGNDRAVLEIALYEYGENPVKLSGFTRDLDAISEKLFAIGIRGGVERCGEVIQKATRELEWSGDPDDLKLIYIAGNEPFTQGTVDYREAIAGAQRSGITVNTIHCGGMEPTWADAAHRGNGSFSMIDHNARVAMVKTPQDAELARLGAELNRTYIAYGAQAAALSQRQAAQDRRAMESGAGAARAVAKSTSHYDASEWDLVDAKKANMPVPAAALPPEMQQMTPAERDAVVAEKAKERAGLQKQIAALNAEREKYLEAERKKGATAGERTLDDAMLDSLRSEAARKSISL